NFPIKYLRCPPTIGRKKIEFYSDIVNKIIGRIRGWHTKLLSTGGRAILIRHVLLALPIHLLAAVNPPKGTIELIEKFVARFFWSGKDSGGKYHWAAWKNLCYPYDEGGANFRRLSDTCKAFRAKQWWNLRTSNSLWGSFMIAKYCESNHPITIMWNKGNSQNWEAICDIKEEMELNIVWNIRKGDVSFWFDNWCPLGPLYTTTTHEVPLANIKLNEILQNNTWNWNSLTIQPNEGTKSHLLSLGIELENNCYDKVNWRLSKSGKFTISSTWNAIRQRKDHNPLFKNLWTKDIPFKIVHIGDNWSSLYAACDAQIQQISSITVRWLRPPAQIVKLNSDGSCTNGQCGGGGIIRNQKGKFIMAYSIPLGEGTSNYAEAEALLFELKWCADRDLKMAIGESDSLLIVKCVKREWKPPWNISKQIKEIQKMIEDHSFREANRPADSLTTLSHRIEGNMIFNLFSDLPNHIKGLVNMDKWDLPTFRIKHTKPSNIIYDPP
ncbi:putative ribonuclease h protein, partial [Nicotiana attenuata]